MKLSKRLFWILPMLPLLGACVTTRQELNQQRASLASTEAAAPTPVVKTEDLLKPAQASEAANTAPVTASTAPATASTAPATAITPVTAGTQASSPSALEMGAVTGPAIPPRTDLTTLSEDELRAELAKVSGQVEELQHEKELKEKIQNDETKKAQDRIAELEKRIQALTPEVLKVPAGKTAFEAGKDAFLNAQWDDAIAFFTMVLTTEETGKAVEEATYLRGESFFKKLQYNKAIVDYSKFAEKLQKSSYHPKALLRIAESFEALGRKEDARVFYSDLIEKFPKTAEGKIAKKKSKKQ